MQQVFTSKGTDIIFNNPEEVIRTLEKESKKNKVEIAVIFGTISTCLMIIALYTFNPLLCISAVITICIAWPICKIIFSPNIPSGYRAQIIKHLLELDRNKKILQIMYRPDDKTITCTYDNNGEIKHMTFPIDDFQERTDIDKNTLFRGERFVIAVKWSGENPE